MENNKKSKSQRDADAARTGSPLLHLPPELLLLIISFLSVEERCWLEEVCTRLRDVCRDPAAWRTVLITQPTSRAEECADLLVEEASIISAFLEAKKPRIASFTCRVDGFPLAAMKNLLSHSGSTLKTLDIRCYEEAAIFLFQHLGQWMKLKTLKVYVHISLDARSSSGLQDALEQAELPSSLEEVVFGEFDLKRDLILDSLWRQLKILAVPIVSMLTLSGMWDRLECLGAYAVVSTAC